MVTWKDYYVERQRRRDEIESARQHRAVARRLHRPHSASAVGQGRTVLFGALLAKLVASLRRQARVQGS